MPRTENQQQLNLARTPIAKRLHFHLCFQFPVSISFPFPAFPYALYNLVVLKQAETLCTKNRVVKRNSKFTLQVHSIFHT